MPKVRSSAHPSARPLFIACALLCASVAALVCIEARESSACSISMPLSLRMRYAGSEFVAVVRVGETFVAERHENNMVLLNTELRISSLLKGETKKKVINLQHFAVTLSHASPPATYEKDDVLLVFLKRAEKGEGYELTDGQRGAQKLPADDLKVYVSRIEELGAIMREEKPDKAALAEWLVRCAEEPATRWEGAYELSFNVSLPEDPPDEPEEADSEEAEAESETGAAPADGGEAEEESTSAKEQSASDPAAPGSSDDVVIESSNIARVVVDINYIALLTPAQKERLTLALLNAEEFEEGEEQLMYVVGSWKDERLVPFLLKHLGLMADKAPYEAEAMMRLVAHMLGDQTLIKFVVNYRKTADYNDIDAASLLDDSYAEQTHSTPEERRAFKEEIEKLKTAAAEALFQRSGKLRHFLVLAEHPQKP
ncbi:MAG TPA: hypothetical protein VGW12_04515 [Pyrinomonadaceae bacterium]|nr:hypothetical protein [Pyrinomonadaceae bacterium]